MVMVNYHQLFFHSHGEVPLSTLAILCLLTFRRSIQFLQPVVLYLALLLITFWLLTKSNFDFYYILFVPWPVILTTTCLTIYLPERAVWQQRVGQGLMVGYLAFSFLSISRVLIENNAHPYVQSYNASLARHMPH